MTELDSPTLPVEVLPDAEALGVAAGRHAATVLAAALRRRPVARLMLAAAPSQQATLAELARHAEVDFTRVECFHMDDYLGLSPEAPQGFGVWLQDHFLDRVEVRAFHRIDPARPPEQEAERYAAVLGDEPFDLVLCGLGVNGHLAFNDPPARLHDPVAVRVVELDLVSRRQQVDEGHFPSVDDVPAQAITVTIPRLLNATTLICSVPGAAKRDAVHDSVEQPVSGDHPGTALRTHPDAHLYVDREAWGDSVDRADEPAVRGGSR